jgi:dTDP-4-dehydrorhamnose reductase
VLVLGHRGLLGTVVARRLAELGHDVITTELRVVGDEQVAAFASSVINLNADVIVNCIAALPTRPRPESVSAFTVNAILPLRLALECGRAGTAMVQPSTDGVFRGDRGGYRTCDPPDATDAYGTAKAIAEFARVAGAVTVIRCSIVGTGGGILRWLLSTKGDIDGYIDHRWNGITALEWADLAHELLMAGHGRTGTIIQPACKTPVSKFDLLRLAAQVFGREGAIRPVFSARPCDRTLVADVELEEIDVQLTRLREWGRS